MDQLWSTDEFILIMTDCSHISIKNRKIKEITGSDIINTKKEQIYIK